MNESNSPYLVCINTEFLNSKFVELVVVVHVYYGMNQDDGVGCGYHGEVYGDIICSSGYKCVDGSW